MNDLKLIIGDADALIALYFKDDMNHLRAASLSAYLYKQSVEVIFPNTAIIEAITTLQRKLSNRELAIRLTNRYQAGELHVEYVDEQIMNLAADLFYLSASKQNTFFDAIVATMAKKFTAEAIFSFDDWYSKLGLTLVSNLT